MSQSLASSRSALRGELMTAHERLAGRKIIERAKGIVMKQKGGSEDEAFRLMRSLSMDRKQKLLDIAQQIIDVSELFA